MKRFMFITLVVLFARISVSCATPTPAPPTATPTPVRLVTKDMAEPGDQIDDMPFTTIDHYQFDIDLAHYSDSEKREGIAECT